jgi:hypothetical protein
MGAPQRKRAAPRSSLRPSRPAPRLFFSRVERRAALIGLALALGLIALYAWYLQGNEIAASSIPGLLFATFGTLLLLLVGIGYALRKRWALTWPGLLHRYLAWHMVGGLLGLLLIFLHTAGSLEQTSGAWTFYGLVGVVTSGVVGRLLDWICPRLATRAALDALDASGAPRRGARKQVAAAMRREQQALLAIRAWRKVHRGISLIALALLLWHLETALAFLLHQ